MIRFTCQPTFTHFRQLTKTLQGLKCIVRKTNTTVTYNKINSPNKSLGFWMAGMAGMTWGAILLGGLTRLTESGLSMVDWHPFKEFPPISHEEWQRKFEDYKQFPEYSYVVARDGEMSLSRFQFIWYMEYSHRMWGRAIGAAFILPAVYFYSKNHFSKPMLKRVGILTGLIGFQGFLGWYMVRSGLEENRDVPRVSHFRLCAHLSSAAIIYSLFTWNSFSQLAKHANIPHFKEVKLLKILGHSTKALMFTTLIWGAFVAGLDAGLVYNSWPKMADRWIPSDLIIDKYGGFFGNILQNPTGVQFSHRMLAYTTCLSSLALWAVTMRLGVRKTGPEIRRAAHYVLCATLGQSLLGITALVHYVPLSLAALHQNGSIALLTSLLWFTHCLKYVPK